MKKTSALLSKDFKPIPSNDLIVQEIKVQEKQKAEQALLDTNLVVFGGGTAVTLVGTLDQRAAVTNTMTAIRGVTEPTPAPTITPTPPITPTPTVTPAPTVTPTPYPHDDAQPNRDAHLPTPSVSSVAYNGDTGNWSDSTKWTPGIVPNNGNNGVDYDVNFSSGTLTQDIADGVTINQLFMSGGTLILANQLTLEIGLQFSGGSIISGILNVAGISSQSALLTVDNTIINNSGSYDLVLNGQRVQRRRLHF